MEQKGSLKQRIMQGLGVYSSFFGLLILIYSLHYANVNILTSADEGWNGIYTAAIVLLIGLTAIVFMWVFYMSIMLLKGVADNYSRGGRRI